QMPHPDWAQCRDDGHESKDAGFSIESRRQRGLLIEANNREGRDDIALAIHKLPENACRLYF
ncbi:MAG TPA: hypothetical protein VMU69_11780, partial [Bradyrhizobium sp.]|nr:hypothetical protein [Bradyrhizobium sp.]